MITFWIAAALLSAGAGALMLRGASAAPPAQGDDPAVAVHRRQLAEIDDLAQRGLLASPEHQAARAEVGRRLIEAADHADPPPPARPGWLLAVLALAIGAPLLAAVLYATAAGAPGAPDQPFMARVAAWKAHPDALDETQKLAIATVEAAQRPTDPQALKDLAVANLFVRDGASAEAAARRAIALTPKDPETYTLLAAAFTTEARQVTAGAKGALEKAAALADALPPADPLRARIAGQIDSVIAMGQEGQAQAAQGQAVQAQAAAGQVTPDTIRQMVQGLAARLKANPDDPKGWVMLVRAYGVLGDVAHRDEALAEARKRYAGSKDILDALTQAQNSQAQSPQAASPGAAP